MIKIPNSSRLLVLASSLLMIIVYFVPIWQIQMWAPQYPDWLYLKIWINNITGDIDIINGLNHYIGMKYIKVEMFPEFKLMPFILAGLIAFGLIVSLVKIRFLLWTYLFSLMTAGVVGMVDFYLWGYDYGHNLDTKAAIKVPGMVYQPPLIGTKELLNFIAYSAPDVGGWLFVIIGIMIIIAIYLDIKNKSSLV
jgi:copper chaperone NosL